MLSQTLAGLALILSITAHPQDAQQLGLAAAPTTAAAASAATCTITGTVVENTFGTILYHGNFLYVGHMRVQVLGSTTTFAALYVCLGGSDPDCAPSQLTATMQVRLRGALSLDSDGRPLILVATADQISR